MPVMDGHAFCEQQQQDPELKDIPVVVFTAFSAALDRMADVKTAARLEKPVMASELLDSVDQLADPLHAKKFN
jgi:CheY-like chemotaxis protein